MRTAFLPALIHVLAFSAFAASYCNPRDLVGVYGFQLAGETSISGEAKPAASVGRVAFDEDGGVNGTSSVKFAGLLLGNPVSGTYEAHRDCTVSWSLEDDSGAYQHFSGVATPGGRRVSFRQTDPGGVQDGLLVRTGTEECRTSDLKEEYAFTLSGDMIPMTEGSARSAVSVKGVMAQDSHHDFHLTVEGKTPYTTDVAIGVESDCTVTMELAFPMADDNSPVPINVRGVLVDRGREILAIQTDPGAVVSARFTVPGKPGSPGSN